MPSWWSKSSKEAKKKPKQGSIITSLHRKCIRSGSPQECHNDVTLEAGSDCKVDKQFTLASKQGPCVQSIGGRHQARPLPLNSHVTSISCADSGSSASTSAKPSLDKSTKTSLHLPLPKPEPMKKNWQCAVDGEGYLATANSADSCSDPDHPCNSALLSSQASDMKGIKLDILSPSGLNQRNPSPFDNQKNSRETLNPINISLNHQTSSAVPMQRPVSSKLAHLWVPCQDAFTSAPDSSMSSPSRSPMRLFGCEPAANALYRGGKPHAELAALGSEHRSNPSSGFNSGHNSIAGDTSYQLFWPHSRCSPDVSPLPSPKNISRGPTSTTHSGAVTPLHPHAGCSASGSPTSWPDNGKKECHPLPLPPTALYNNSPFMQSYSAGTSPRIPSSPGRTDNPPSRSSHWKKGRLLGRGTFGHVYLAFNSESGEMCAMKEVTLCPDDAKSRESIQQLGQEIGLLSRLCHPNIVQYYGSEMVDDKLCIYLEYVSGGSICKILQEYGKLREAAIRSYTQQILSGLAYLHSKNMLHRDIKGANILVDPNGRVKLADFGMSKHIAGEFCPLSFKGSPYWMAPEIIKNSGGCSLAVDIWSLGCTVLEMATAKPPWSQYEGVAAMFKIGNSKELPAIPDHLSDEGKDFVMQCLQRNPRDRPSAAQMLEHPFVKISSSSERLFPCAEPIESVPALSHAVKILDVGRLGTPVSGSPGAASRSKSPKTVLGFSDGCMARNISCPVSPIGSPLSHSRSPHQMSGMLSSSPVSSPLSISGASTPAGGTPPKNRPMPANYWHESTGMVSASQKTYPNATSYCEPEANVFRGIVQAHLFLDTVQQENKSKPTVFHDQEEQLNAHLVLSDRVSQQVLWRNPRRLSPVVDAKPKHPSHVCNNGI